MTEVTRRQQVVAQCKAVAVLARQIAEVHEDLAGIYEDAGTDGVIETVGKRTARLMEELGDTLNGMDAVTDEDDWMQPTFELAHEMFPLPANT